MGFLLVFLTLGGFFTLWTTDRAAEPWLRQAWAVLSHVLGWPVKMLVRLMRRMGVDRLGFYRR